MSHGAPCAHSEEEYQKVLFLLLSLHKGGLNLSYQRRRSKGRILLEAPRGDPQKHDVSFCANSSRFETKAQRVRVCLRNGARSSVLSGAGNLVGFRGGKVEREWGEKPKRDLLLTDVARATPGRLSVSHRVTRRPLLY